MAFFIRILTSFRCWIVVFGCVFLGLVLGDLIPMNWAFQQPTYLLEKDTIGLTQYTCDTTKTECKVNFDFTPSLPTEEPETHYECSIDFGFGMTGEEAKCNPGTVIFPAGEHTVKITVKHKETAVVVKEGTIRIYNTIPHSGGEETGGNTDADTGVLPTYSAEIEWQNSTNLALKTDTTLAEYTCDSLETECRINLRVIPHKNANEDSDVTCRISASFDMPSSVSDPCNPLQSSIPTGDHTIIIQIVHKSDSTVVANRVITVKNPPRDTSIDPLRVTSTFIWQSPTYLLLKDNVSHREYTCDPEESDCKINLLVTPLLDGVEADQLTCEIISDFSLEPTTDPCNPNTSLVPKGDHSLTIRILQKSDGTVLQTHNILLKNPIIDTSLDPLRVNSELVWQSPTYLLSKEDTTLAEYTCDPAQPDCKINLLLKPLLDGIESTQLTCEITSDFELIPTSDPCNPNTSLVPTGDHVLTLKILQKTDNTLLVARDILLKNPERTSGGVGGSGGGGGASGATVLDLNSVAVTIQSGLDADGRCRSDVCQVNFLAEVPTGALCRWDFGTGVFETSGTDTKCNPGYVKFPSRTSVALTVSDPNKPSNSVQKTIQISRLESMDTPQTPQAHIDIQGVIGKNKRLTDEGISCAIGNNDTCSLNFTGEESQNSKHYFWDFGNGNTSEKENPGVEKFPLGRHRVVLRVQSDAGISSEAYLMVYVVQKFDILPEIICLDCHKMKGKLQISAVLPNPPHADTVEWIEIKNISSEAWDLESCTLSDSAKSFALSGDIQAGETLMYRQAITRISLGNTSETLELRCGEYVIDTFSWNFPIPSGYILRREMLDNTPRMATVIQTVDGDTVDVTLDGKKTRIRLLGVDTPETVHPLKSIERFGKEASDFTRETLTGKTIWMTSDHELLDHYGRMLAYIWLCRSDDFDVEKCQLFNARLITEGYARMERRFQFMYYDDFDALEKEAKKKKVGIWSDAEVARDLEKISDEEAEKLKLEQTEEYLRLQQELLELAKQQCEGEGICDDIPTWSDLTHKMTTFSVRSLVSGVLKISGRTWGDYPLMIKIYHDKEEVYTAQIRSNNVGEYMFEWYPKIAGEYHVEMILVEKDVGIEPLTLKKSLVIEHISEHFLVPLSGGIILQGTLTKNRWRDSQGFFQCRSRGSCSVNLTAEYNRKSNIMYTWTLPSGEIFIGKNPPSFKVEYGDFIVKLQVHDTITDEQAEDIFVIQHTLIPKAPKKISSQSSKYTLDLKDATQDIGGGVLVESSMSFSQSLFALCVLGVLSLLSFGKENGHNK